MRHTLLSVKGSMERNCACAYHTGWFSFLTRQWCGEPLLKGLKLWFYSQDGQSLFWRSGPREYSREGNTKQSNGLFGCGLQIAGLGSAHASSPSAGRYWLKCRAECAAHFSMEDPNRGLLTFAFLFLHFPSFKEWARREEPLARQHYSRLKKYASFMFFSKYGGRKETNKKINPVGKKGSFHVLFLLPIQCTCRPDHLCTDQCGFQVAITMSWETLRKVSDTESSSENL